MALIIVIRRIVIAAILAAVLIALAVTVTAARGTVETKAAGSAVPEYWYGYWPGNPTLCVLDQTDGLPVIEAVAEFKRTVVDLEVRDSCGETETIIIYSEETTDRFPATTASAGDGEFAGVVWIMVDPSKDLTKHQWHIALTHELGHAVGLDHTARQDSIMNPKPYHLDGMTETDLAVLKKLYQQESASAAP